MTVPHRLSNGPGNWPDADKYMRNWDYLDAIVRGSFLLNAGFESWPLGTSFLNPSNGASIWEEWSYEKGGTSPATINITQETSEKDSGAYSVKANVTGAGSSNSYARLVQSLSSYLRFAGETMLFGVKVKTTTASKVYITVYDGTSTVTSSAHTGDGTWQKLSIAITVAAVPTELTMKIHIEAADFVDAVYLDSAFAYVIPSLMDSTGKDSLAYSATLTPDIHYGRFKVIDGTLSLADSDVAQPMTSLADANVYGLLKPLSGTAGGLSITGLSDTDASGLYIAGVMGATNPTDTTPAIRINGSKNNGSGSSTDLAAAETVLRIENGSTTLIDIVGGGYMRIVNGSNTTPAYTFLNDTDTGMYLVGSNNLGFACNGFKHLDLTQTALTLLGSINLVVSDGNAATPGINFGNDTDCGLCRLGTNKIALSAGGTARLTIESGNIAIGSTTVAADAMLYITNPTASGDGNLAIQSNSGSRYWISADESSGLFLIGGDGASRPADTAFPIRIDSNQNVGINTTPGCTLHVVGDTGDVDSGFRLERTSATTGRYAWAVNSSGHMILGEVDAATKRMTFAKTTGYLTVPGVYDQTSGSAANVVVDSSGNLMRSTSSLRYKTDVENVPADLIQKLGGLRPVIYKSKKDPHGRRYVGLIAEEVHAAGLRDIVDYDSEGRPDAVQYDRLAVLLLGALHGRLLSAVAV